MAVPAAVWFSRDANRNNTNNFRGTNPGGGSNGWNAAHDYGWRPDFHQVASSTVRKMTFRERSCTSRGTEIKCPKLASDAGHGRLCAWCGYGTGPHSMCSRYAACRYETRLYGDRTKYTMTNEERREARYQRRQEKRARNAAARTAAVGALDGAFSFDRMFRYGHKCCNGVRWKQAVQNYERHLLTHTAVSRRAVLDGSWRPRPCVTFHLVERGKHRIIDAPYITDRQIHKTLVNEVLTPLYRPRMIADNAASMKGGGLHFQYMRIKKQLGRHFRKHGRRGGVLLLDLAGFFPNANRALILQRHDALIEDPQLRELADRAVLLSPETSPGHGMALGLELSQIEMTSLPSAIDQWLKCQQHIAACGHYMDDYYVICEDMDRLRVLAEELISRFAAAGIPVNAHKTRIQPLTKPFRFCKSRFTLTETGRVIINRCRDGMKRSRRKLRMLRRAVEAGERTMDDVEAYMESQSAYYRRYNDHGRLLRLKRLYHAMFKEDKPCSQHTTKPAA